MQPRLDNWNVKAKCPDCGGALSTFEHRTSSAEFGSYPKTIQRRTIGDQHYTRLIFRLLRCASCERGALAEVLVDGNNHPKVLCDFYPKTLDLLPVPHSVPEGITKEFREAEQCASFGAHRAASAMFRSTLEKTLKANGYNEGDLYKNINKAADDGVITETRRKKAHDEVRVLGNDVLHDEWREVMPEEVEASHRYTQRVLEDLYDDRPTVESTLKAKKRLL